MNLCTSYVSPLNIICMYGLDAWIYESVNECPVNC